MTARTGARPGGDPARATIGPASAVPLAELAATFTRAFDGYVGGTMALDRDGLAALVARQGVDLARSRVAAEDGRPLGFALVAPRGRRARVAAMGVVPEAAGRGLARALLERLRSDARDRGDLRLELEVIEQNERAARLYRAAGLEPHERLLSFRRAAPAAASPAGLVEAEPEEVAEAVVVHGDPDLPWPVDGFDLARLGPPVRGWRQGDAWALAVAADGALVLRALVVGRAGRRAGAGRRLLDALQAAHPGLELRVPALCPARLEPFFRACGCVPDELSQLRLRWDPSR